MTTRADDYTASELLAVMSARLLRDGQVVFAGVGIPLLAATLAQRLHAPGLTILFEGGVIGAFIEPGKLPPSTNEQRCTRRANMVLGSTEVLLLLQRGYIDSRREAGLIAGGMYRVVTDLGIFGFEEHSKQMELQALHPGVTADEVQANTGFELLLAADLAITERPTQDELAALRHLDPERLYTA